MAKSSKKKSFIIYEDWMNLALSLPDENALDFVRTLFSYCLKKDYDASPLSAGLLETVKDKVDADVEEYEAKCRKNQETIRAYWESKQAKSDTKENKRIRTNTNVLQTNSKRIHDNDDDNDDVYDDDYDDKNEDEKKKKMCSNEHMKEIVDEWNKTFAQSSVPKVTILKSGSKREKQLKARLDEFGLDKIRDAIKTASESSFLRDSSWFSFDWFICPSNFVKIVEGNYTERGTQNTRPVMVKHGSAEDLQNFYDSAVAWAQGG